MIAGRERDVVGAALAAIKAYFVEPAEPADRPLQRLDDAETAPHDRVALTAAVGRDPGHAPPHGPAQAFALASAPPAPPAALVTAPAAPAVDAAQTGPVVSNGPVGQHDTPGAPPAPPHVTAPAGSSRPRPVIAVFGLAPACGASTVARALGLELAARDPGRVAAVRSEPRRGRARSSIAASWLAASRLSAAPAGRLAAAVADFPGADVHTAGRLCLVAGADRAGLADGVPHLAPLVLDEGSTAVGGVAAAVADRSVVVTTPSLEPALAALAADCIARVGPDPIVVVNRVPDAEPTPADGSPERSTAPAHQSRFGPPLLSDAMLLPEARLGARFARRGREPRGELQRAIVRLADRCLA